MSNQEAVEQIFREASQRREAGFGTWSKIDSPLQITVKFATHDKHWVFDPNASSAFAESELPNSRSSLIELSAEVFLEVTNGKLNLQQAYLDGNISVYGCLPQVLQYGRLFDQLQESSQELQSK